MSDDFLPDGYQEPSLSNYMSFEEGANTFRVLGKPIMGLVYWQDVTKEDGTKGSKPIRVREGTPINPGNLRTGKDGSPELPKFFWAMPVYNFRDKRVQILEITQKTVRKAIENLVKNPKWGNPTGYNIVVERSGSGFDTEYVVNPEPKDDLDQAIIDQYKAMNINLEALYEGGDPFASEGVSAEEAEAIMNS